MRWCLIRWLKRKIAAPVILGATISDQDMESGGSWILSYGGLSNKSVRQTDHLGVDLGMALQVAGI